MTSLGLSPLETQSPCPPHRLTVGTLWCPENQKTVHTSEVSLCQPRACRQRALQSQTARVCPLLHHLLAT